MDWKRQTLVLVLYRFIFKPLKTILTGRKLVPDYSFAATTALAGGGRSHPVPITIFSCLWVSVPSEDTVIPREIQNHPQGGMWEIPHDSGKDSFCKAASAVLVTPSGGLVGHVTSCTCSRSVEEARW